MDTQGSRRWMRAAVLTLVGLVAAWSWLVLVSQWGPDTRTDILTFRAGYTSQITRTLIRQARGTSGQHSHSSPMLSAIYATPEYFAVTEQMQEASRYQPDRFLVFFVFEDMHVGELPRTPVVMTLRLGDGRELDPVDTTILRDSVHHRASVVRFAGTDAGGGMILDRRISSLELVAHEHTPAAAAHAAHASSAPQAHRTQVMRWDLPIIYPQQDAGDTAGMPLATLVALLAGLVAVLSPCLLQLTVYYTFALAGFSMQQNLAQAPGARGQVIRMALYFVAGFTIVFTLAGLLAGLAGEKLQTSGLMEAWNRPLMIAAGLGILILGVWVGASSGAPGMCRLPAFATALRARPSGWLEGGKAMFMGSAFAIGCSTCFGGALFVSLMIYVGAIGSASLGALALFVFSMAIAVPYLVSAVFLSRALPLVGSLQKAASGIGLVCSVVLIFFGVILITDTFHIPSDFLYRLYLGPL